MYGFGNDRQIEKREFITCGSSRCPNKLEDATQIAMVILLSRNIEAIRYQHAHETEPDLEEVQLQ